MLKVGDILILKRKHELSKKLQPNYLSVGERVKILAITPAPPVEFDSTGHRLLYTHITFSPAEGPHKDKQFVTGLLDVPF
jgi:hypothetical protein